jgi:hypothetical protein
MAEITYTLVVKIEPTYQDKTPTDLNLETIQDSLEKRIQEACESSQDMASVHFVSLTKV